ncbi:MAG: DUF5011 domain-containing protein, partial [Acidimicrobiia bacterium]|nr:DUF5011 domain-containing protein [Acidimicrobiia bacterium]
TTTEAANRIENNAWDGVAFGGAGTGNTALGNSITGNTGLGIDHNNDGVTPNGAGNPLDFPAITSATESGGTVTVDFALTNTPDGNYRIEFFDNTTADPSGNGEGETWVGSVDVTVTGGVPTPASTTFAGSAGDIITATATEGTTAPFGATSEFSAAMTVVSRVVTVNSTGDAADNNIGDDICNTGGTVGADPECTLRAAIEEANASATVDTIHFDIPQTDGGYTASPEAFTIEPASMLPNIATSMTIDGSTQTEYGTSGRPVIEVTGSSAGSNADGFRVTSGSSTIRGLVVNNWDDEGFALESAGNSILGNYIGTDVTGSSAEPNKIGVVLRGAGNTIGGLGADGNLISGNTNQGIMVTIGGSSTEIIGNLVGTDASGSGALPNGRGIDLNSAGDSLVGGTDASAANTVAYNSSYGLAVTGSSTGNSVLGNAIHSNGGLGIDLNDDGVTSNDAGDGDTGQNDFMNFPVITSASESGGTVTVDFGLDVLNGSYRIEFFDNTAADPSGNGEGETWVGSVDVTVTGGVPSPASTTFAGAAGDILTATATEGTAAPFGSTSEFSAAYTVTAASGPGGVITDLGLWLRADIGVTASAGEVSSWADQSGNGNDATQGTAGQQPDLVVDAVNGNPVVNFDGTNDFVGGTAGASSHSFYVVVIPDNTISSASPGQTIFAFDCAACVSDTAFLTFGDTTGTFPDEIVTHGHGGSAAWRVAQTGTATYPGGDPVILASRSNAALDGTDIYADGLEVDNAVNGTFLATTDEAYNVATVNANSPWPGEYLDGKVAEVISYFSRATDAEHQRIQSYLAIKYGLTLDQTAAYDYLRSDGTVIWNATTNASYNNDIAGIGQDDTSVLDQTQSGSISSDSIVTMSNASSQGDGDFLVWGNDDGATTWTTTGSPVGERLQRTWRVDETGSVGTVTVALDVGGLTPPSSDPADFHLLIDADGDFSAGATDVIATSYSGGVATFNLASFSDGDYFTLAVGAPAPNNPPNAVIVGGPYTIAEGDQLDLDGSGSSDPDTDPLTYRWDLDNDGQYDDETGVTPSVSWASLASLGLDDDGGPFTIGLEVDDGIDTDTDTTTLTITNTPPTVLVTGSGSATAGSLYTVNLSVSDPGDDTVTAWRIDWGDGTYSNIGSNPATASHPYTTPGYHEIRAAVTDEDGTFNATTVIIPQYDSDEVLELSSLTGDALRTFANAALNAPVDAAVASDGYLYVVGNVSENVVRFDAGTGAFESNFIPTGTGGLAGPGWIVFPAETELWASTFGTDSIKAFARTNGAYIDEVVAAGVGGLAAPSEMTIGPDGDLYVTSWSTDYVHRYDAETGLFKGLFVSTNLNQPTDLAFGPDGDLYVTDFVDGVVRRFNGTTGAYEADVLSLFEAYGITFGPDGLMYVTSQGLHQFNVYDLSGTLLGQLSNSGDGLSGPSSFDFVPSHYVTVGPADSDGDGLWDHHEDANTDADNDPTTNPGPNTDGDANPNYLDDDDDGDGTPTASENADPNGDGDPRDAVDSDRDAQPDYLDLPTTASAGAVVAEQVISGTLGGLAPGLGVSDHFGRAIAPIGDLDGDGVNDVAVGAPNDDDGSSDRGAVYILFMNGDGTVKSQQKISDVDGGFTAVLDNADEFGISLTGLGDLDGDGINDIAVGAHQDDDGLNGNGGAVYVLFLNANGTVKSYQKISETEGGLGVLFDANDRFGGGVANIGDLDGNGLNDIVVGAKDDDDGVANAGAVYVVFLNSDGTVKGQQKISQTVGGLAGSPLGGSDGFGIGVAGLGDVDGDGNGDIAVGSYWDDDGGTNHGAAYVLFLDTNGTVIGQQKISDTEGLFTGVLESNDEFGTAIGAAGDIDGDGVPDLIVGTPKDDDGNSLSGAAYVLFLNGNGTVKSHQKISNLEGGLGVTINTSDQFGFAVAGIGDLDGDGTIGIAVGAFGDDDGFVDSGSVYVLNLGTPNGPPTAVPGGPYSTDEGDDLVLDGSGSTDPDTDPLTYNWDVDNDGQYDDATGVNPTIPWLTLIGLGFDDDGGPYPIGLEVDDGNGNTDTATVTWTIANTPPTISVSGSGTVGGGLVYTANLSVSDPGDDTVTEWTINWGDGNIDSIVGNPASATHTYANPGEYNITAAVADEDSLLNRPWHNGRMVVPGLFANQQLFRLEATTGAVVDNLAAAGQGWAIAAIVGPDGLAYVGDYSNDTIRRYNPVTGADLGVWIPAGTGGLDGPAGMQFGPDGHLYVSSNFSDQILEFDTDGTFLGVFAAGGGLDEPDDLTFGPDGHLYVTSFHTDEVLKYNGRDGHPMGVFASGAEIDQPSELVFGPGGKLYVTSVVNNQVVRYNANGSLDTIFATAGATGLNEPRGATFGPDGHLYVGGRNRIVRYDGSSGALIDIYLPSGSINGPSQSVFIPAHPVSVLPFIVNSTGDASDNNPGDGVCYTGGVNTETNPECTLRAAIEEANAFAGTDTINFDMPAAELGHSGGVWTIAPGADYDPLIETVIIDGTTQTGWTTTPVVELDGNGAVSDGFRVAADDVEIHGLAITRFPGDGIDVATGAANAAIVANHIGLDASGLIDRGNVGRGIYLGAGSGPTRVGGGEFAHRNVISGNGSNGIVIGSSDANTILNNFIGTDSTGNAAIENGADGIYLGGTSASNVIGQVGDFNVISGNADDGVENNATGTNNIVYYNVIGIGADATTPVSNGRHGVVIYDGANNTWVYQNLIAGNAGSGVVVDGNGNAATSANNIIGNWIGINLSNAARPNSSHGVNIFGGATMNVVGGLPVGYRNIISGNGVDGIRIEGSATSGNRVENNHIGTNIAGDAAVGNGNNGIWISGAPSNTVGGATAAHRNVISGNGNNGVLLDAATATGNTIQGNYVGLNAAGDAAVPNADEGVDLSDAPGNLVGGDAVGARNVISGNGQDGVLLIGAGTTGNFVSGNYIGTNAAGDASVANGRAGVYVDNAAATNDIGGPTSDWGNVISGNTEDGIYITDAGTDLNRVKHNYIGTNAAGDAAVPNGDRGVQVESGASFTWIGDVGQGNVISGNTGDGIIIADWLSLGTSDNYIIENLIGVAADGTTPLGNGANGVHIDPVADTLIGTNTIAHNAWDGVLLEPTSLTGNSIVGNSIYSNGQLGIDLGNDGVTTNDPGDGDPGPNNFLNYPEITSAVAASGNITIQFDLDVPPGDYRIEFFDNSIADPSGNGEGETYVDSYDVLAHPGGSAGYSTSIPGTAYDIITATTTEQVAAPYGSSSEFSAEFVATAGTMTVNSTGDGGDTVVGDGLCDTGGLNSAGDPECTLRAAIEEANFDAGADDIEFDIPVGDPNHSAGIWTIAPGSQYDNLNTTMSINGATQPGWAGDPVIQIDGSADLTSSAGLNVFSSNTEIRGLILHSFPDEGIESDGSLGGGDNNTFAGNWVGIDASGAAAPNGGFGILLTDGAANNTVGGPNPEDANVVGGNAVGGIGVWLLGTDDNRVYGNFIGVLNDGVTPVPNSGHGIDIDSQATGNEIGGTSAQANTIRSNTGHGVYLSATAGSGNSILRNVIAANSGLGINLDDPADPASGVTPNDPGDGDGGPNGLLNHPVIDSAVIAPPWITVNYTIDAPPGDYVVEFFSNPSGADPSGNGEGEAFEYRDPISHPGGSQSYVAVFSGFITDELTATLTEDLSGSFGSTSEFSAVAPVTAGTLVVNSTGNAIDAAPGNGACDTGGTIVGGDPECTLNAAIQEANALGGTNEIHFAIPDSDAGYQNLGAGSSYWKIRPAGSIDPLTADDTTIDATTQTSYAVGQGFFVNDLGPEVELDGSLAGGNGLEIQSSNNEARGFVINRFATGIAVLSGDGNVIAGNFIGPDPTGAVGQVGNTIEGVEVDGAANTVIGGSAVADRNVISGNNQRGIALDVDNPGTAGTQILGNYIGTNAAGDAALLYNATDVQEIGVYILNNPDTVVGTAADGNVISGNSWFGIYGWGPLATGTIIQGNIIGLDATGSSPVPNATDLGGARAGVSFSSIPGALIGGDVAGQGNVIAENAEYGIVLYAAAATSTTMIGNQIYSNADLGIDLNGDGVSVNAPGDPLNYPEITSATESGGTVTVDFDLDVPLGNYRIEFFVNPSGGDPSGYGEGETLVHSYNVVGHPGGAASYGTSFAGTAGDIITATTTEGTAAPYGSTSEFSAAVTVTFLDTTPPVITLIGANPQVIEVGSPYVELGATALDDVDGDITGLIVIDATAVNTAVLGSYPVTYNVSDSAGNPAIEVTRTVDVVDTTAPVLTLVGANPQVIEVGSPYVELGATATDNYDGDLTGSIVINSSAVNTAVVGTYVVTYDVVDSSGNPASGFRTVDVVDTTAPVITLIGANPQTIEVGSPYVELGATASDNYDGDLTGSIVIDASAVNTAVVGSYSVTYDVTDSQGNPAVQVVRTVDVVDTTAPVITLVGANPQTIEVGSPYVELGATAFDVGDGDLTGSIVIDATAVNTAVVGSYSVTYDVTDSQGNPAIQVIRTVDVVDTTAPVITLVGANPQTIEAGSPYVELGATATDNYDGNITGAIVIDASAVDTGVVGSYPVTYDVTDSQGNPAVQVIRTVDVVDTTAPVITLVGANPQTINVMSPYVELGATALDNHDGDITGSIVIDATAVNTAVVGSYSVTYDVTDSQGNPAIQVIRTVDVVNVAPTLGAIADQTVDELTLATFTATASDPDPTDGLAFGLSGEPSGATIDPVSGVFTWTPTEAQGPNSYTFDVVVTDSGAPPLADSQTITITVSEVNLQPTLNPIPPQTVDEQTVMSFVATAGDPDVPANGLTFILSGAPAGAAIDPATGVFTWIPAEDQGPGIYSFDVQVSDNGAPVLSDTQPVTITVNEVNTAPVVTDPGPQTDAEADTVSLPIAASDGDVPANVLTYSAAGLPDGLSIDPVSGLISGTIDYSANAGSPFSVTVAATDDGTPTRTGQTTFVWTVNDTNRPPVAVDDVAVVDEDTPVTIDVVANDSDPDGDAPFVSGFGGASHGTVSLVGPNLVYVPDPNYNGSDTFGYTLSDGRGGFAGATVLVSVTPVNDAPSLSAVTQLYVDEGNLATFVASASDLEGDVVTFSLQGEPTGATIDPSSGTFTWIPAENQGPGSYTFAVRGTDNGAPPASASRSVQIHVAEVNRAPIVTNPGTLVHAENQSVSATITGTDPDIPAGSLTYSAVGLPPGLAIDPLSGEVSGLVPFDASAGSPYVVTVTATDDGGPALSGSTTFNWVITNTNRPPAAFDITVFADAGVPVSFVLNGTDPDGDVLSFAIAGPPSQGILSGGPRLYDYTPAITAGGTDVFTFVVSDGALQATGTVTVFITPNLPPEGGSDEYTVRDQGVLVVEPPGVLANDSDPEGRPISAIVDTQPAHGTLQLRPDGSFVYRHLGSVADIDVFSYRIDDGMQLSAPISVVVNIEENVAPVAVADEVVTNEDTAVLIRALDNDYDPNNETVVVSDVIELQEGSVSWSIDGVFRYTPPPNWYGSDVIRYEITDGELVASAVISIEVLPVNDPPQAFEAELTGDSGEMMLIDLSPYATDADGDVLDFLLESPPTSPVRKVGAATFELDLDGVIADLAPLTFIVSDPSGARDASSLMLRVRIPAELVGIPSLVADDIRRGEDPDGGIAGGTPTNGGPMVTGLRLMVGSVLDTFRAFRFPMLGLVVVLLASLWLGLSRRFAFSATPTLLP